MSDRCWIRIIFRREHRETVCDILGMGSINYETKEWTMVFEEEAEKDGVIYASALL